MQWGGIIPYFEDTAYQDIDTVIINDFIEYMLAFDKANGVGGLSTQSVRDVIKVLRIITKYAETKYSLPNPIRNVNIPKLEKKTTSVLNKTECSKLQKYLLANLNYSNLGILITMFSGLRIGELCALTWGDIDLFNGVIYVSKTVQRIKDSSEKITKQNFMLGILKAHHLFVKFLFRNFY